jgi:hypothetical protein
MGGNFKERDDRNKTRRLRISFDEDKTELV